MTYQVSTTQWLPLSKETREKLAVLFHLTKKGHSVVHGGKVISDGYTNLDLQGITIEKINAILETSYVESDILKAFNDMVFNIENPKTYDTTNSADTGTGESTTGSATESSSTVQEDSKPIGTTDATSSVEASPKATRSRKAK